jgi:Flp pilus assembly protein CpaB
MKAQWMLLAALAMTLGAALPARAAPDKEGLYAGYRGISIPMSGYKLAFVEKGDRIDVLVTFEATMKDNKKEKVTATFLQNVVVVNVQKPAKLEDLGVVELLLNPTETQYAALSSYSGELSIAQRAEGDVSMVPMEMASLRKLLR